MTPEQIGQLINIIGVLVTTLNAFILWYIANHQKQVARDLKASNGTLNEALKRVIEPPQ
jgi:hypothetical protein